MLEHDKGAAGGALVALIFATGCTLMAIGLGLSPLFAVGVWLAAWSAGFIVTARWSG